MNLSQYNMVFLDYEVVLLFAPLGSWTVVKCDIICDCSLNGESIMFM